ncbi:PAS domain S-box protein [Sinimarinibacterium sp. CAU 1509]|uniref:PAS domain S-box protein n=1 Tax=Sinimarinibacterium sp. CAU 1509 TaxID=2562283 RepID=UPI0010AD4AEB|nr:PAS domain S-box protein [Sinimarinibacterium sp. CAU 1509]TJY58942.1 PAS domain S-box protein [Sinimarinibacterium sp. CAU 1509]
MTDSVPEAGRPESEPERATDEVRALRARLKQAEAALDQLARIVDRDAAGHAVDVSTDAQDVSGLRRLKKALQESERRQASMLGNVQLAAVMLDVAGRVTYCNDYFLKLVGWHRDDVIGVNWFDRFVPPEARGEVNGVHNSLLAGEPDALHHENEILVRDGSRRLIRWDNVVLRGLDGAVVGEASLGADITEYRRASLALEASERRLRKLIENASDVIAIVTADGTISFVSQAVLAIAGYAPQQLVGTHFLDYSHPDEREFVAADFAEILGAPGKTIRKEQRLRHQDGSWLTVEAVSSSQMDTAGIHGIVVTLHDVTWRKQAEHNLRLANAVIERSSTVLFRWRAIEGWPVEYVSDNVRQWGYEPDVLLSGDKPFAELVHPEDLERIAGEVAGHVASGATQFAQEYRILKASGEVIWVDDRTVVERDPEGAPVFFQGVVMDISERKRANQQLSESHQLLEGILNAIPVRVFWKDRELVYLGCNARFAQDAGFAEPKELVGKTDDDMPWHDQVELYRADDRAVIDSGQAKLLLEEPQTTPAGDVMTLLTSKVPLRDAAGQVTGVLGIYMDVTEQKRGQENLKLFRALVDQAETGIEVVEPGSMRFLDVNQTTCRALGYSREEMLAKTVFEIDPNLTEASQRQFVATIEQTGSLKLETVHLRKDGSSYPVEINLKKVTLDREYYIVSTRDLTELRLHEARLQRVNRALLTLSAGNAVVVHATSEQDIVQRMCEVVVEKGGYRMAWVGYAEDAPGKPVRPVGWAGEGADYVERAEITWADDENGRGPTGRCIRSGEPQVALDIASDPTMDPWRERALRHGYRSSLTLPLTMPDGKVFGALMIYAAEADAFDPDERALLIEMCGDLAYGIASLRTQSAHEQGLRRLARSLDATVESLAHTVELRDPYTAGHQRRVADIAVAVAAELGLSEDRIKGLRLAASIHDIGKISIPAEILAKPARLTPLEYELVKGHAEAGFSLLHKIDFPWPIAEIIRQHHERIDGSGYPRGLSGDDILLEAKILAVADVVESMASHRPYRAAQGIDEALVEIEKGRGTLFDEAVADACLKLFRQRGFQIDRADSGSI